MIETIIIIFLSGILVFYEIIPLWKDGQKRSAALYITLLSLCLFVILLMDFGISLPTIYFYYKSIMEAVL